MGLPEEMASYLKSGERAERTFTGVSAGLNASPNAGRMQALLYVLPSAIVIGVEKPGILKKRSQVERFNVSDIMQIREDDVGVTGLAGAIERKNASHAVGRAMGHSGAVPAITLRTRRGDVIFAFKPKERGLTREAYVAISDLLT